MIFLLLATPLASVFLLYGPATTETKLSHRAESELAANLSR